MGDFLDEMRELTRLRGIVRDRISELHAVVDKLPLYDLVADAPAPITPTAIAAPQKPSHLTVNIQGTVGTLNTGEVLGSIHSHVSAVTGSSSADAFRGAIDALAAAIAQDPDLSDVSRMEALESIDGLAEEAGREPEKQRRGVLRGMLLAIPGALQASAHALEAWDKFGSIIQAHVDQLGR